MSAAYQKLRSKLSELFQLDAAAELDFGIYRILNARRVEISEFLDSLEGQVDRILAEAMGSGAGEARAELAKAEADLRAMGLDDAALAAVPKIRELRGKIATGASDPTALSHEIFSHLATFFSRYYQDGDFISLRRYKKDTYAIPYEGEEVKLHWANADQYYIKSSETLRDYAFRLGPAPKGDKPDTRPTVIFKLVEADIEKDNAKAVAGQERRFMFQGVVESASKDHLILGFAYLPLGKAEKQTALNEAAAKAILTEHAKGAFTDLAAKDPTYTGSQKGGRSILAKHLAEYTGRNTFDYFVHKDLGGFLRRELDFYVKNEVLHLDDLDEAPEANWNETRAKLKALRSIAAKVIRFLAHLEDFQKKLWLKKKFVTACDYVVTLDRIPEELYPEIAACDAQREEWVRLFAIDEIQADLGRTGYSVPVTVEFLKENQFLPVVSSLFPLRIRDLLMEASLQAGMELNGLLLQADNLQAMRLVRAQFGGKISGAYLDPPYNTEGDRASGKFIYKDGYDHSTWLSLINDRVTEARNLLSSNAAVWMSIDDNECHKGMMLLQGILGKASLNSDIAVVNNLKGRNDRSCIATSHEHLLLFVVGDFETLGLPLSDGNRDQYDLADENGEPYLLRDLRKRGGPDKRADRPKMWFPIYYCENSQKCSLTRKSDRDVEITPKLSDGSDGRWRWGIDRVAAKIDHIHARQNPRSKEWSVSHRVYLNTSDGERRTKPKSVWLSPDYSSDVARRTMLAAIPNAPLEFPKAVRFLEDICWMTLDDGESLLDIFAGSGTTGHAVINLNREDGGDRKYILIEMGEHFDTVLVPRLKKAIYSKDWKDGKPQSRNTGVSHCFKILRLESYEDTLNNLRLHRTRAQELALETMAPEASEEYRLGYMLDLEANGSQSLLNVSAFTDPWNYTMEIATGTAGETKTTKVDLVETFNWLLGLTVLAQGHGGGVQWVEGTNPEGDKVLVLWRNTTEVDADALNDWCKKQKISVLDGEFGLIYVNGDHHLENLRREDQTWKVRLTDEEFPKLMWEGCE
jgi:adenine-specific DNA-methyltransferase